MTLLSLLSLNLDGDIGFEVPFTDKIVHFLFYLMAMLLGGLGSRELYQVRFGPAIILKRLFLGLFSYGILIELLQAILPTGRSPEIWDVVANTLGLIAAFIILIGLFKKTAFLKWRE